MWEKVHTLLPVLLLACFVSRGQNNEAPNVPQTGKSYSDFVPKGWDTLGVEKGDLNKDGKEDLVVALKSKAEEKGNTDMDNDPARYLLIAFNEGSSYRLLVKLENVLMCQHCGGIFGDPFNGLTIKKGVLNISHYGGSAWKWLCDRKYRYQNDDFYLIGKTDHSFWNVKMCEKLDDFAGTNYEDVNFVTGGRELKKISEDCKLLVNKKDKIKVKPLVKMADDIAEN